MIWRTGRKVGRTIYRQLGDEPGDDDELIGVMDTPELAREVVESVNPRPHTCAWTTGAAVMDPDARCWCGKRYGDLVADTGTETFDT